MKEDSLIKKRFEELDKEMKEFIVAWEKRQGVAPNAITTWMIKVKNLISLALGEQSVHFKTISNVQMNHDLFISVFQAAKSDYEGGYIFNLDAKISGEILGDFINLAKTALSEGHKDVAAVLACAALEDALKKYAIKNGIIVSDKATMQDIVNALKSKGLVSGAQSKILGPMPTIRDYAMHASWDKISPEVAGSVIGFVESFLLNHY